VLHKGFASDDAAEEAAAIISEGLEDMHLYHPGEIWFQIFDMYYDTAAYKKLKIAKEFYSTYNLAMKDEYYIFEKQYFKMNSKMIRKNKFPKSAKNK
ncbi:unnamed protein product, partial [marine sediment metagenome]